MFDFDPETNRIRERLEQMEAHVEESEHIIIELEKYVNIFAKEKDLDEEEMDEILNWREKITGAKISLTYTKNYIDTIKQELRDDDFLGD